MKPLDILAFRFALGGISQIEFDAAASALHVAAPSNKSTGSSEAEIGRTSTDSQQAHRELYGIYRAYIQHEDELTHRRLGWNLAAQGFLFTAYGFIFSKTGDLWKAVSDMIAMPIAAEASAEAHSKLLSTAIEPLLRELFSINIAIVTLAIVGIGIAAVSWIGTRAAHDAIQELVNHWHELHPEYGLRRGATRHGPKDVRLPGLIGGGSLSAERYGFKVTGFVPALVILAWAMVFAITVVQFQDVNSHQEIAAGRQGAAAAAACLDCAAFTTHPAEGSLLARL
jgi:hypothetical protein